MSYIKGITIEIDGETKGLDAALRKINTTTRNLQNELKRVDSLLKLNPGNTDLVRQKQELLKESITETETKLEALKDALKQMKANGVDETSSDYRRLQREIQETDAKLKQLAYEQKKFVIEGSKLGQVAAKMGQIGQKAKAAAQKVRGISTAATLALGAATSVTSGFDSAMSQVMAISGATGQELDRLRDKAREMGEKTKFSAEESANAFNYMAMAGWKTDEMLSGIEGIMNLAAASGEDLATTSDIVTDALTAMGYAAGDSGRLADVMAAASANANTNVGLMGETFKYAAAVAGSLHYSMEDVALATGLMANAGIKGTQAGTSLRSIMSRMAAPTKQVQGALDKLGVSLENADGTTRPFRDVMIDLREKMAGMSDVEKTQIANALAGKNAMSGFLAIINAGEGDFNQLADAIDNSNGAACDMANTMLDNLGGQLTILKSALQELAISMGDTLVPMVKRLVAVVQSVVDWFNNLSDTQKALITKVLLFVAALAPLLAIFGGIASGVNSGVMAFARLYANIATSQGVIGVLVKTVLPALKTGLVAVFNVLRANPIGMVITIIGLLIAAFVALWKKSETFRNFWIGLWQKLKAAVSTAVNGIKTAWNAVYNNLISPVKKAWTTIKNVFSGVKSHFSGIGKNIVSGIWSGLSGQLGWIKSLIKGWVGNVKSFIKRLFGIHSPSRWMKEQIGTNLAKGLGIGFEDELGTVNRSIANSLDKTMTVMSSASLDGPSYSQGPEFDYNQLSSVLVGALSKLNITSNVNVDGKTIAQTTAPFMEKELNSISRRANRRLGTV